MTSLFSFEEALCTSKTTSYNVHKLLVCSLVTKYKYTLDLNTLPTPAVISPCKERIYLLHASSALTSCLNCQTVQAASTNQ